MQAHAKPWINGPLAGHRDSDFDSGLPLFKYLHINICSLWFIGLISGEYIGMVHI